MACTAKDLERSMNGFIGGSDGRTRHALNRKFIYTDGVKTMAERAEAYWLLDMVALQMAPIYAKAWMAGNAGIGIVTLEVFERSMPEPAQPLTVGAVLADKEDTTLKAAALATLSLEDEAPLAFSEEIGFTDFPAGKWTFYLGTDEVGPDEYVTTMCLPQEY